MAVQIHMICIAFLSFLTFSSIFYRFPRPNLRPEREHGAVCNYSNSADSKTMLFYEFSHFIDRTKSSFLGSEYLAPRKRLHVYKNQVAL